jgi:hypothetical protein
MSLCHDASKKGVSQGTLFQYWLSFESFQVKEVQKRHWGLTCRMLKYTPNFKTLNYQSNFNPILKKLLVQVHSRHYSFKRFVLGSAKLCSSDSFWVHSSVKSVQKPCKKKDGQKNLYLSFVYDVWAYWVDTKCFHFHPGHLRNAHENKCQCWQLRKCKAPNTK